MAGTVKFEDMMATVFYSTTFTNATLAAGVLTVTHNLGVNYLASVTIWNNNGERIPVTDLMTKVNTNSFTVDLSSFGVIAGTWSVACSGV